MMKDKEVQKKREKKKIRPRVHERRIRRVQSQHTRSDPVTLQLASTAGITCDGNLVSLCQKSIPTFDWWIGSHVAADWDLHTGEVNTIK